MTIARDARVDSEHPLRWWHMFFRPRCYKCGNIMQWKEITPGYPFAYCDKCQIIRN